MLTWLVLGAATATAAPAAAAAPASSTPAAASPASPAASPAASDDDDGPARLSLPTEADRAAWQRTGFRLGLAVSYGWLAGVDGAPSGRLLGGALRVGLRLDRDWSLLATMQYQAASATGGLAGLRFAGTIEPTWHVTPSVSVALGVGFGGIVEGRGTGRADVDPLGSTLDTSYTFPDASTPLPRCSGVGAAALVRGEWSYVLGPRTATAVALELDGQYTRCVDATGRVEPDTARPIERRQYWPHAGAALTWGITWR